MAEQTAIRKLTLTNFRNYGQLTLSLERGPVVLTGDNGAGKTNLLEAISFLTPGRGLRRAAHEDIATAAASTGFAINAKVEGPFGEVSIGTGTLSDQPGVVEPARRVRINGVPAKSADDLLEWLRIIWLVPSMDSLFNGPAGDRRRFLDRLVLAIDPQHGRRALDYEKAMRGRNRLLAEGSRDDGWFEAIETQMAETGVAIASARMELVGLLAGMVEKLPDGGPFPKSDVALDGVLEVLVGTAPAVDIETAFIERLADNRARDRAAGRTLEGPHRSDLTVAHRPKAMPAALCSTGEQKALLTGMILSQARLVAEMTGATPILLLDEIAAHLDPGRRAALFSILTELDCQAFMTGTDAALFSSLDGRAQFLDVNAGTISPR
ncbi:DNA replication/repair protein RecF [Aliihoeflea sp. 40Bstr573]|uniref:DNA replication/repair protein RecF n=1 Tax=Aliihoeflea sp. 40Bstr573 TaxID=2696467 RepID=UPI00209519B0|nr:DNA replication/repair protein RecF [Aliihoeflea sp. 40Bstr573]MCO6387598.1 DNA replication/repair protein RecF [Aliihoeflea sp. 40Bstr573]